MEIPEWFIKLLPRVIRRELYWQRIEYRERENARVDHIALKTAKAIKRALPDAFVYKIRDNCYMASYGYAYLFIDAKGVLVREWGGYHKVDAIDDIVKATLKADAYWVEKNNGKTMSYEWHRSTKMEWDTPKIIEIYD